jgi:dTDP-4-amino-4,6-dideoxygalactose transaminase
MRQSKVFVTKPFLPPLEEIYPLLEEIWNSRTLTNDGPLHRRFEKDLRVHLGVAQVSAFCNGSIALLAALKALEVSGEIITTPYSFVVTAHTILWNNLTPVFVDVEENSCNIDPEKIEDAITDKTSAILAVHCYGMPCRVESIEQIANKHGLKVIYDAAHAFGVEDAGGSILRHGDLSVLSFHATKVFNTFEGGAIVSSDEKTKRHIDYLKNFGFEDETIVVEVGINGKMSEFGAALGILQLRHIDDAINLRRIRDNQLRQVLSGVAGIKFLEYDEGVVPNYAYFPIFVKNEYPLNRDGLYRRLARNGIHARRYFYPLITDFPMYRAFPSASSAKLANAMRLSNEVLCLPIYPELSEQTIDLIGQIIRDSLEK